MRAFVPLDLTDEELKDYLDRLKTEDNEWQNLKAEIQAIAEGSNVKRIAGDQVSSFSADARWARPVLTSRVVMSR